MKLKKVLKWIALNPMEILATAALVAAILMAVVNAITRYTIHWTWNPVTDLTTLSFGWMVFCGAAAAYKRKMHYGIDLLVSRLPHAAQSVVLVLSHIITAVALITATYLAFDLCRNVGGKQLPNTKISYLWYDLSAVVGFLYMSIYEIQQTVEIIKTRYFKRKEAAE